MQNVVTKVALGKLQPYLAIVMIFTYSILLRSDFECTCKRQLYYCIIYAVTPGLIATVLMLWSNRLFQRTCSYRSRFKCFICYQVLKAALVGLLWVAFLLIDGDWWACCFNKLSERQAGLPCKAAANRNDTERETMAAIKTTSRVSGCWLLFLIVFSGAMSSWTRWRSSCSRGETQYEETLYYKLVLEEEEAVLKEVLRKSIRNKLTKQIEKKCEENWKECFKVAEKVIKNQVSSSGGNRNNPPPADPVHGAECQPSSSGQTENAKGHRHGYEPSQISEGVENIPMENVSSSGGNRNNPPPADPADDASNLTPLLTEASHLVDKEKNTKP